MAEPLTSELLTEWRQASLDCPEPISLDRKIIDLVDLVLILRAQRDDLQARNTELVEQRRTAMASRDRVAAAARAVLGRVLEGQKVDDQVVELAVVLVGLPVPGEEVARG